MDLNSLPDELMARVLKNGTYPTVIRLRKMDSRIDRISLKYEMGTRLPVRSVQYEALMIGEDERIRCRVVIEIDEQIASFLGSFLHINNMKRNTHNEHYLLAFRIDVTNSSTECEQLLEKIQVMIHIKLTSSHASINGNLITGLLNQSRRVRDIGALEISSCNLHNVEFSKESIDMLMRNSTKLRNLFVFDDINAIGHLLDIQVLSGRRWDIIYLDAELFNTQPHKEINIEFLNNVVKNSKGLWYFAFLPQFTVVDLLDFIERCVQEDFFTCQCWKFGEISSGNSTAAEIIRRLDKINNIHYKINYSSTRSVTFMIYFHNLPEVVIRFEMLH